MNSIKQNPKFAKLLTFSLNCLMSQTTLPNNKHRDNARYLAEELAYQNVIQSLVAHSTVDLIVQYAAGVLNRMVGMG